MHCLGICWILQKPRAPFFSHELTFIFCRGPEWGNKGRWLVYRISFPSSRSIDLFGQLSCCYYFCCHSKFSFYYFAYFALNVSPIKSSKGDREWENGFPGVESNFGSCQQPNKRRKKSARVGWLLDSRRQITLCGLILDLSTLCRHLFQRLPVRYRILTTVCQALSAWYQSIIFQFAAQETSVNSERYPPFYAFAGVPPPPSDTLPPAAYCKCLLMGSSLLPLNISLFCFMICMMFYLQFQWLVYLPHLPNQTVSCWKVRMISQLQISSAYYKA